MITILERLDGTRINLFEKGIMTLDFVVSPIDLVFDSESIRGRPGRIRTRDDYGNRKVILKLLAMAQDRADIPIIRDELAAIIDGNEPFYVYESVTPKLYGFELPGQSSLKTAYDHSDTYILEQKRLLIQRTGNESLKFDGLNGKRSIEFETYKLPFWESTKTTVELSNVPDNAYTWKFNTSSFIVWNLGNEIVDPRYIPLVIKIKGSFPNGITLTNQTTGDVFKFNGVLSSTDTLEIRDINYFVNGLNSASETNYNLITLKPGENQILITGGTVSLVEFDFRFHYR
ncbi:phage tail family protein [Lysinibacillus halotolerans]